MMTEHEKLLTSLEECLSDFEAALHRLREIVLLFQASDLTSPEVGGHSKNPDQTVKPFFGATWPDSEKPISPGENL